MELEYQNVPLEIKALKQREFSGHGSTFGNVDLGGDIVMRGAFAKTLAEHKGNGTLPQMFWMHRPDQVPGKWLEMSEDDKGLAVHGVLAKTQLGDDMHELMNMQAVRGLSIGYMTRDADYNQDGIRLIKEAELFEVSIVSLAMNPKAEIESSKARMFNFEHVPTEREFERILRDAGFSKSVAIRLVGKVFRDGGGNLSSHLGEPDSDLERLFAQSKQDDARPISSLFE